MSDQHDGTPHADASQGSFESNDALSGPDTSRDALSSESYESSDADSPSAPSLPRASEPTATSDPQSGPPDSNGPQTPPVPAVPASPDPVRQAGSSAPMVQPTGEPVSASVPENKSKIPPLVKRIGIILLAIVVAFVVRSAFNRTSADVLEVGQCVSRDGDDIAEIACTDAKARYKVLLIKKDTNESLIEQVCSTTPAATTSYFESQEGAKTGNIICLGSVK